MAKKNRSQPLVTPSTATKPSEVASTAKKPSEVESTSKKPSEVASTAKKPSEVASTSNMPLGDVATSKDKKQPEPVKTPLPESSSEEEESESEEEESESEGEEEDEPSKDFGKTPSAPAVAATANQSSSSESESESQRESDSETEPPTTKTAPPASASPIKKRQSEGVEVNESKRPKTDSGIEMAKKAIFERVWTEEDEVLLLKGMIDFRSDTGKSPYNDKNGFFERVKKSISFEVTSVQFWKKIWSLKIKYLGQRKSGVEPTFSKPHDTRCLELANMIWETEVDSTVVKSEKKTKVEDGSSKIEADWFERSFLVGAIKNLGSVVDEESVKKKWSLVPVKVKKRIEEKMKSFEAIDNKWVSLKADLVNEVSQAIFKSD